MDFIVRVEIGVNGLAEEDFTPEIEQVMRDSYVQYPSWVKEYQVKAVRELRCFEAIREMLMNGMPTVEAARQIHLLNEWKDKKLETVRGYLEHFKATLPKTQMLARMVPNQYMAVKKEVDQSLDCMVALEDLYRRMIKRLDIGFEREKAMGFLMPNMEKQFAVTLDIISRLADVKTLLTGNEKEIAQDMTRASAASRIDWTKIYSSPNVNEVMANPERRARLVRFTENLSKMYGQMTAEQQQRVIDAVKRKAGEKHEQNSGNASLPGLGSDADQPGASGVGSVPV